MARMMKALGARPFSHELLGDRQVAALSSTAAMSAWEAPKFMDRVLLNPATLVQPREELHDHDDHAGNHDDVLNCFVGVKGSLDPSSLSRDFSQIGDEPTLVVTVGGSVSGVIDVDGDVDLITVELVAGERYSFSLRGTGATPLADTFLEVFGIDGTTLVSADDDGGNTTNSMLTFTAAASGVYTIEAAAFDDARDLTGGWTLDVRQQGADESTAVANAVAINVGDQVFGFTNTLGDNDYFAVTSKRGLSTRSGSRAGRMARPASPRSTMRSTRAFTFMRRTARRSWPSTTTSAG